MLQRHRQGRWAGAAPDNWSLRQHRAAQPITRRRKPHQCSGLEEGSTMWDTSPPIEASCDRVSSVGATGETSSSEPSGCRSLG